MKHRIYLSLGSNVDKESNLPRAVALLEDWGQLQAVSPAYETAPVGAAGSDSFLNAAALLVADLEPEAARLEMVAGIESRLARVRDSRDRNAPRTIDVDISLWDDEVLEICGRPVPDPDILRYLHLARPLAAIAPDYLHPVEKCTLAEIAAQLESTGAQVDLRADLCLAR